MFVILAFASVALGPLAGFLGGMTPKWYQDTWYCSSTQHFSLGLMRLYAGVWSWTYGALAGVIVGWIICGSSHNFVALQIGEDDAINGIVLTGWFTAMLATAVGLFLSKLNTTKKS